jgi:hypothetical protein
LFAKINFTRLDFLQIIHRVEPKQNDVVVHQADKQQAIVTKKKVLNLFICGCKIPFKIILVDKNNLSICKQCNDRVAAVTGKFRYVLFHFIDYHLFTAENS